MDTSSRPWLDAWADSAYGEGGFWRAGRPAEHFRTASSTPLLAEVLVDLLTEHPEVHTVVELGAGDGRLLTGLSALRPELSLAGVDLRDRPDTLPASISWCRDLWDVTTTGWTTGSAEDRLGALVGPALILCVEWLDDLPCPIAARAGGILRLVEVDRDGSERLGAAPDREAAAWARRWSPWSSRLEIGLTRDLAWAAVCALLRPHGGLALLVDYGHLADRRPAGGSLSAYQRGRRVDPRPSPELNLTAAVAIDSVTEAGRAAGATTLLRARQSEVVASSAPTPPGDPLKDLVERSHRSALRSGSVWGDQWWLLQQVAPSAPDPG
jgi:putative S-adenosyl-L-methionine-dependent methyltransferase